MRNFAKRLIVHETIGNNPPQTKSPAAFYVFEKLRPSLVTLMGNGGFRALLSRALALAHAECPGLRAVHVNSGGSLERLEEPHAQIDSKEFFDGAVVLMAHLLGLMVAFIGENLTWRLVQEVWPKVPPNNSEVGEGDKNEKTG